MKNKVFKIMVVCILALSLCACKENSKGSKYDIVRSPGMGINSSGDYKSFEDVGLRSNYHTKRIKDEKKENAEKTIQIGKQKYVASYETSNNVEKNDSYYKKYETDEYVMDNTMYCKIYKENGKVSQLYINSNVASKEKPCVEDFSEEGLKKAALSILEELYGEEIYQYIDSYYIFEYAEKEDDKYCVSFRAYINNVATNDAILIDFTSNGEFKLIYMPKYLLFLEYDTSNLIDTSELEKAMAEYLKELGYKDIVKKEDSSVYRINDSGELYYNVGWECTYTNEDGQKYVMAESLALKATK